MSGGPVDRTAGCQIILAVSLVLWLIIVAIVRACWPAT